MLYPNGGMVQRPFFLFDSEEAAPDTSGRLAIDRNAGTPVPNAKVRNGRGIPSGGCLRSE